MCEIRTADAAFAGAALGNRGGRRAAGDRDRRRGGRHERRPGAEDRASLRQRAMRAPGSTPVNVAANMIASILSRWVGVRNAGARRLARPREGNLLRTGREGRGAARGNRGGRRAVGDRATAARAARTAAGRGGRHLSSSLCTQRTAAGPALRIATGEMRTAKIRTPRHAGTVAFAPWRPISRAAERKRRCVASR